MWLSPSSEASRGQRKLPWAALTMFHSFFFASHSRGHYLCSVYAARLMVPAGRGLIVIISSIGGLQYLFSVPYGVGKAAVRTQEHGLGRYRTMTVPIAQETPQ